MKRLLAISWDMPPMSGPRAVQVSRTLKHLVPLGWESTVVCFGPRSTRYNQDPDLAARLRAPEGVTLVHVPSQEERFWARALWRVCPPIKLLPDEKWVWIRRATRVARRLASAQRFDVLVSFAQPWSDHLIGRRVKRATGLPWVAHFSDPWTESPYLRGRTWQRRLWARMESRVVAAADRLVFVNTQTADATMQKYPDASRAKARVVPHGFDCDDVANVTTAPRDDRLFIVYTGRFYDGIRTPAPLLRALARLNHAGDLDAQLQVVFVGTPIASHRRLAVSLGLERVVRFVGRLPFAESTGWAAAADVLLVIDAPATDNLFLPSKLIDYLAFGAPLLALSPRRGATADVITALDYPIVPPDDEPAIAAAIGELLERKRSGTLGRSPRHDAVAARYDIRRTAAAFADILAECT